MRAREGQRGKPEPRATCLVCGCSMPYFLLKTVWISKATCQGSADAPPTTPRAAPQDTRPTTHDPSLRRRRLATLAAALDNSTNSRRHAPQHASIPCNKACYTTGCSSCFAAYWRAAKYLPTGIATRHESRQGDKKEARQGGKEARRQGGGNEASRQRRLRLACFEIVGEQLLHRQAVDRRPDAPMTQSASGTGQKTRDKRHKTRDTRREASAPAVLKAAEDVEAAAA